MRGTAQRPVDGVPRLSGGWIERQLRRRHHAVAVVATLLSAMLHLLIVWQLPSIGLGQFKGIIKMPELPPFKLHDVKLKPDVEAVEPPKFEPAKPEQTRDATRDARSFHRPTDEGVLQPGSLGAGAIETPPSALQQAEPLLKEVPWQPRQEILKIEQTAIADKVAALPRRLVPDIDRVSHAADVVLPAAKVDSGLARKSAENLGVSKVWSIPLLDLDKTGLGKVEGSGTGDGLPGGGGPLAPMEEAKQVIRERTEDVTELKPVEQLLSAEIQTYTTKSDPKYGYCRIDIHRAGPDVLPVLPKDVVFVQDCSGSITEQRLHFCREGLLRSLALLGPKDRFNLISFRDRAERCFPQWGEVTPANIEVARGFIENMRAIGNTDIYASMNDLLSIERVPGRPVIAIAISDGEPTTGLIDSTDIIAEFSRRNAGGISVFTMGTLENANMYLLDLFSYRNRGDTAIPRQGRWSLPETVQERVKEISRPVLVDMHLRFASLSNCEAFPVLTANLYLDRPLVLYGRYPIETKRLVFQVVGQAGDLKADMVFDLDLEKASQGDRLIREQWAWQKVYDLIGELTRTRSPVAIREIRRIAKAYAIQVPYEERLAP